MIATGRTVGLAEWIIDDTCLVNFTSEGATRGVTFEAPGNVMRFARVAVEILLLLLVVFVPIGGMNSVKIF